jgi:hypothetical protein
MVTDAFMPKAFGLLNGLLPVAGLMALAVLGPMPLARWIGLSHRRLAASMVLVAGVVMLAGAVVLAFVTRAEDAQAASGAWDYLLRSLKMALGWGPLWALVWLVRAQGIETRRGLRMGRED